jgi:hypothetical protein
VVVEESCPVGMSVGSVGSNDERCPVGWSVGAVGSNDERCPVGCSVGSVGGTEGMPVGLSASCDVSCLVCWMLD